MGVDGDRSPGLKRPGTQNLAGIQSVLNLLVRGFSGEGLQIQNTESKVLKQHEASCRARLLVRVQASISDFFVTHSRTGLARSATVGSYNNTLTSDLRLTPPGNSQITMKPVRKCSRPERTPLGGRCALFGSVSCDSLWQKVPLMVYCRVRCVQFTTAVYSGCMEPQTTTTARNIAAGKILSKIPPNQCRPAMQ